MPQDPNQEQPQDSAPEPQGQESDPQPPEPSPESPEEGQSEEAASPEGDEPQGEGEEPSGEAPAAEPPKGKHRRSGGFQRKIDRLERQNQELIAALTARGGQPPAPTKTQTPEEKAASDFQAMVKQAAAAEVASMLAQNKQQAQEAEFNRRAAPVRAKHPDFDEAYRDVVTTLGSSNPQVAQAIGHSILTSEAGPEIMYQLASNPDELARIAALAPLDAAREVWKLEAKASGATPQAPKPAARPPAPPSRVNGSSPPSTRSLESLPLREYKRAKNSERR